MFSMPMFLKRSYVCLIVMYLFLIKLRVNCFIRSSNLTAVPRVAQMAQVFKHKPEILEILESIEGRV